ncbi:MAG TPA: FAD-binding and (Fe-S)-binding domain-containing protein, partial [Syntrophorhabdales bacterium]|nr:FAD-binding and (Fe-S)-binding domain-containing protein [Syntrophorhabdales bacterium]
MDLEQDLKELGVAFTTSPFERWFYTRDTLALPRWTSMLFHTMPLAIVKPGRAEEVASVVRFCSDRRIPVVPRGAGTSGLFGAVPKKGGVVLDLRTLSDPVEIDRESAIVHAGAGIICRDLDCRLRKEGLALTSYPSSALSATLGGWIMGSGLGIGSLAHGAIFDRIISMETVLADGTRRTFAAGEGLEWLYESEGTLAIVTRVSVKVRKAPEATSRSFVHFTDGARLFAFVSSLAGSTPLPFSIEIFDSSYLAFMKAAGLGALPSSDGGDVLVAYEGDAENVKQGKDFLEKLVRLHRGEKRGGAESEWDQRFNMLRVRRAVPSLLPIGVHVPMANLDRFFRAARKQGKREQALLGQVVSPDDCMAMVFAATDESRPVERTAALSLPRKISQLACSLGGKPGGGIGVWNAPYKNAIRGRRTIKALRKKKKELDPKAILNPGMWFDPPAFLKPALYHPAMKVLSWVDWFVPPVALGTGEAGLDNELASCVECGFCMDKCPTKGEWLSSTPRGRIRLAREMFAREGSPFLTREESRKSLLSCSLCGRCKVDCSVAIDSPTLWVDARARLTRKGLESETLRALVNVIRDTGNIAGKANEQRQHWAARLPQHKEISARERAKTVYFVGCVTSFYPTVQDIARSFVQTLVSAGSDFMLLGGKEVCCGYPLISAGRIDEAVSQMRQNVASVRETGAERLVVTCPGCLRMWKHEYKRLAGEDPGIEVVHSTEFLMQLIEQGKLSLGRLEGLFTYHDPCDLGRVSGIYDAPRSIIGAVPGISYVELEENRQYSACCGSGGDLLASDQDLSLGAAARRLDQVERSGAGTVVTACPSCIRGMIMSKTASK